MSATVQGSMSQIQEQGMTPVQSTGHSLNAGKDTAGFSLYEAFAIKAQQDARIDVIRSLVAAGLTCEEFDAAVKAAITCAAHADKQAGFVPADEAKGRDKYGPKQSAMVQRASEMRQVFGYFKQAYGADAGQLPIMGYLETLKGARDYLKASGKQWDGSAIPSKEEKQEAKQTKAMAEATKAAMLSVKKAEGESTGAWFARVAQEAENTLVRQAEEQAQEKAQKAAQSIVDGFSTDDVYSIGLALIRGVLQAGYIDMDALVSDLTAE